METLTPNVNMEPLAGFYIKKLRKIDHTCPITKKHISLEEGISVWFHYKISDIAQYLNNDSEKLYWVFDRKWEDWITITSIDAKNVPNINFDLDAQGKAVIDKLLESLKTSLGVSTKYIDKYDPSLLVPVSRKVARDQIGFEYIPFQGCDIWCGYEVSYLDTKGKPCVKMLQIAYDSDSDSIIESKSLKLYLNSFNQTKLSGNEFINTVEKDLKAAVGANTISVRFIEKFIFENSADYTSIDNLTASGYEYNYNPDLLTLIPWEYKESGNPIFKLSSNLLKSNCRHSGLPDWGSCYIEYQPGLSKLDETSLLQYIISFRNVHEFHEECCERIFNDLFNALRPQYLKVSLNYTRRGGLDINPTRIYSSNGQHQYDFYDSLAKFRRTERQ